LNIQTINTVETSAICDNNCPYCPAPEQDKYRDTGFMSPEIFQLVLDNIKKLCDNGTQQEVNLFGIGEPLLNPNIIKFVEMARNQIPMRIPLHLNTNGNILTEEIARAIKDAGITHMTITDHDAYSTVKAIRIMQKVGIPTNVTRDPILKPNNWAGQVDWFKPDYTYDCQWLGKGQVAVQWDGKISTCCIDSRSQGIVGHISEDISKMELRPHNLCIKCHHIVPASYNFKLQEVANGG
jgi:organic radical activating enzyme